MRRDFAFLDDIIEEADEIARICHGLDLDSLILDRVRQAAVLHHRMVIGEAANRLSPDLRNRNPEIPWPDIISQRNRVVHDYFGLDWTLLWKTVVEDVPLLRRQVARMGGEAEVLRSGLLWPARPVWA
jgi:uncharacterized protein with HEPN domain